MIWISPILKLPIFAAKIQNNFNKHLFLLGNISSFASIKLVFHDFTTIPPPWPLSNLLITTYEWW